MAPAGIETALPATRRLQRLHVAAGVRIARMHPHMLRHIYVTTEWPMTVMSEDCLDQVRPTDTNRETT